MEFTFTGELYIDPSDLTEMKRLMNEEDAPFSEAFDEVVSGWDDCDYYLACYIKDQVEEFILMEMR